MRLLILTQYFPPEMGAPQARLSELGERLIDLGWQVECLTALPNYPTGRVFPGYQSSKPVVEAVGRIRTARVPLKPAKSGFMRRLRCYFSFAWSAIRFGGKLCQRPDLLFVESPPLFIGFAARRLARIWRCPYVFNVSDLWPDSAVRMGIVKPGFSVWLAEKLELHFYRHAAGVTGQSQEIIDSVRQRSPRTRAEVITNGVDPSRFGKGKADSGARAVIGAETGPVFMYAGLLGWAQGLDQVLDLAKSLPADQPGRFVLVGDGPVRDHLARRIAAERISRVKLAAAVSRDRVAALLAAADAAIITLGLKLPGAVPSKIYEAMASALPILLVADGEAAARVRDAKCGLAVPPGSMAELREAFVQLAGDPALRRSLGEAGRKAAETTYSRDHIAAKLHTLLQQCLPSPKGSPPKGGRRAAQGDTAGAQLLGYHKP
jgi:glycosyltransferase involved in cell wall biosynthesis